MLNLRQQRVVVVGGGPVGLGRAREISLGGADVLLVDPAAEEVSDIEGVKLLAEVYHPEQLAGAFMVFCCTDDPGLNKNIAADARASGAMVNIADNPNGSDFHMPVIIRDGDVTMAISTGGCSPSLARQLGDSIELPDRIGLFAACLGQIRKRARLEITGLASRKEILIRLADSESYQSFLVGGEDAISSLYESLKKEIDQR